MKKTCTRCRYWELVGPSRTAPLPETGDVGMCMRTVIGRTGHAEIPDTDAWVWNGQGVLVTRGHFGCTQWEENDQLHLLTYREAAHITGRTVKSIQNAAHRGRLTRGGTVLRDGRHRQQVTLFSLLRWVGWEDSDWTVTVTTLEWIRNRDER